MSDTTCACGRPLRDGTFCTTCAYRLDEAIAQVGAYHGLAWDLELGASRQVRLGDRTGPRAAETPLPYDDRPGRAADALHRVLAYWADLVATETGMRDWKPGRIGPTCPPGCGHPSCTLIRPPSLPPTEPGKLAQLAVWLRPRVGWLRHHPRGQTAFDEITAAVANARRAVDRPPERTYVGSCDNCAEDMYVRPGASVVICPGCDELYDVETRRRWLLTAAEDVLATATEIARAVTNLGQPVTAEMIRGYAHRGRLLVRGRRTVGGRQTPVYRLGDVLSILTDAERQARAT